MPKRKLAPARDASPFTMALSLLERVGPLTIPELEQLAALVASRQEPGAVSGIAILGRTAIVDDHVVAAPATRDEAARATLKGLELVRPIAAAKSKGAPAPGLKNAVLAQLEAVRTAVSRW